MWFRAHVRNIKICSKMLKKFAIHFFCVFLHLNCERTDSVEMVCIISIFSTLCKISRAYSVSENE